MRVESFDPIADARSRVLILGSMPGAASLRAGEYYAHPQNAFWSILGALLEFDASGPYEARVAGLRARGVALWDVLHSCVREGSLDADIEEGTIVPNRFEPFLRAHAEIRTILFNGAKAEQSWRRHVLPELRVAREIAYHRVPSTSPANASIRHAQKLAAWRAALRAARAGAEVERSSAARSRRRAPAKRR